MARSMWSGAISFGLVNVPIKLYSAVSKKSVRFHQLNGETGNRIQQKRVDPETGEEVSYENIVKGYELTRDRYVVINPDELEALAPEKPATPGSRGRSTSRTSPPSPTSTRSTTTPRTTSSRTRARPRRMGCCSTPW